MDTSTPPGGVAVESGLAAHPDEPGPLSALVRHAPAAVRAPVASSLTRVAAVHAGKPIACALVGGWLALLFAAWLGGLDVPVAGSIAAQCLVMVLLAIAVWDLVVRWGWITRGRPLTVAPQPKAGPVLQHLYPWTMLLAGIACGHFLWK